MTNCYGACQLENACPSNATYVLLVGQGVSSHEMLTENEQVGKKHEMYKIVFLRFCEVYFFRNVMTDPLLLATFMFWGKCMLLERKKKKIC